MEFLVRRSDFAKELQLVQGIVERKNSIPVLGNVLLEARGGKIRLAATDLDQTLRCGCDANVIKEGTITLGARKLYDMIRALPESDVHLVAEADSWAKIDCDRVNYRVAGMPREDFPALPPEEGGKEQGIPADALRGLIERTVFAVSQEESRYYLAGALLVVEADSVAMAATDGHRLAFARKSVALKVQEPQKILVPRKAIQELQRLLEGDGEVSYHKTENHLVFRVGDRSLSSKLVEGQFPAYEKVIGVSGDKNVVVDTSAMLMAVRRVVLVTSDRNRAIRIEATNGKLELSSSSPDLGEAREVIPVEYSGEPVSVVFNGQYLVDFLTVVGTTQVLIELKDGDSQGLFRPRDGEEVEYRYIVMPMRL